MSRFADAWSALIGKSAKPGEVYGDRETMGAVGGLLPGAVPYGVPPRRGERELMVAQKRHYLLHAITRRIGQDIASTPWKLFAKTSSSGAPVKCLSMAKGTHKQRHGMLYKSDGGLRDDVREIVDHPLLDLLHRWNPVMGGYAGFSIAQIYLDLKGETFLAFQRNGLGMPIMIWPIPGYWIFRTPFIG